MKPTCRICGLDKFDKILDMGDNALVNSLVEAKDLDRKEEVYPLKLIRCSNCSLVQVEKPIDSHKIYKDVDYLYYSSDMPGLEDYFREYVKELSDYVTPVDGIVEIGSNDGIMLKIFQERGNPVLGVDPATNVAVRAIARGVPTLPLFFDERLAKLILAELGDPKLIYGNNCIAHIDNLEGVMRGVTTLLGPEGLFVVECNYWGGMVKNTNYALVYHDHFSYFSLKNWVEYAPKFGLKVFDAWVTPAQGGSLRVFMTKDPSREPTERFKALLAEESKGGSTTLKGAKEYGKKCLDEAKKLFALVDGLKKEGKTIAGYGAAAKGFSVLKLAGIDENQISYFIDDSPAKQGKYTPVSHIPVYSRAEVEDKLPDYFFITAPNYELQIVAKEKAFHDNGGKFVTCDSRVY